MKVTTISLRHQKYETFEEDHLIVYGGFTAQKGNILGCGLQLYLTPTNM